MVDEKRERMGLLRLAFEAAVRIEGLPDAFDEDFVRRLRASPDIVEGRQDLRDCLALVEK